MVVKMLGMKCGTEYWMPMAATMKTAQIRVRVCARFFPGLLLVRIYVIFAFDKDATIFLYIF